MDGDINGNGENDKIKFTIASHAAGDGNRTFTTLPDGTVIDEFDSAAFLAGAIVDESTDPPFTLGAGSTAAPSFDPLAGGLTGPTTATSTLLNPVLNAGFSFVDADNDQLFTAGTDVRLDAGELADGLFDTQVPEGGYATVIPGAGLVVDGDPISAPNVDFRADGNLVVTTDLTATGSVPTRGHRHGHHHGGSDGGGDISLTSRTGDVNVSGATLTARRDIELTAAGNIDVAGATLDAGKNVELDTGGNVDGDDVTTIKAGRDVEIEAGADVFLDFAAITAGKDAEIEAGGAISVIGATIDARREVELEAGGDITADDATITAGKDIEIESKTGSVTVQGSVLRARREIEIEALDAIFAAMADISAGREIEIEAAGDVDLTDAILVAGRKIDVTGATVEQTGATLTARRVRIKETA